MISPEALRELLEYDPETGVLTRRSTGKPALASNHNKGYKWGTINNRQYLGHRVAWAIYHGAWPDGEIDHINGDRSDNRISNIRSVSRVENCRNQKMAANNTSGYTGVYWATHWKRWKAVIFVGGKGVHLGTFKCVTAAAVARKLADEKYGFHENHGRA